MSLSFTEIQFLQRLVADRPETRTRGAAAQSLYEAHRIGLPAGRRIFYTSADLMAAELLLKARQLPTENIQGKSRADRADYTGLSEKHGSAAPTADSVAVKCARGTCLMNGEPLYASRGGYMVLTVEQACRIEADRILLVENLESFRYLEDYSHLLGTGELNMMAVFRGMPGLSPADAQQLLVQRSEPTWAFVDFDPAGLGIAEQLPRLERLVLPDRQWLSDACRKHRRTDLYEGSVSQYTELLSQTGNEEIRAAWKLLCGLRAGLPQEWMTSAEPAGLG